jgi:CNT family concentrative nucleoside transporter
MMNDGVLALQAATEAWSLGIRWGSHDGLITSYSLCGIANFGSLGMMIGGFTVLVPERRKEVVALGMKSIVAGTLAAGSTGAVVGLIS